MTILINVITKISILVLLSMLAFACTPVASSTMETVEPLRMETVVEPTGPGNQLVIEQIEQLKNQIEHLEIRLSQLESSLANSDKIHKQALAGDGWKSIANWRKLTTGMGYDEVRKILGEPESVIGGVNASWSYGDGNCVVLFIGGKAWQWLEPE